MFIPKLQAETEKILQKFVHNAQSDLKTSQKPFRIGKITSFSQNGKSAELLAISWIIEYTLSGIKALIFWRDSKPEWKG